MEKTTNLNMIYSKMLGQKSCGCDNRITQILDFSPHGNRGVLITFGCCDQCAGDPVEVEAIQQKILRDA